MNTNNRNESFLVRVWYAACTALTGPVCGHFALRLYNYAGWLIALHMVKGMPHPEDAALAAAHQGSGRDIMLFFGVFAVWLFMLLGFVRGAFILFGRREYSGGFLLRGCALMLALMAVGLAVFAYGFHHDAQRLAPRLFSRAHTRASPAWECSVRPAPRSARLPFPLKMG